MTDDAVAELLTKQAVTEVLYTYCRALDRMDREAAAGVWHPGATADYRPYFKGSAAGFIDWVWDMHSAMAGHSHQITNILIRPDGDTAVSESYVTVVLHAAAGEDRTTETVVRGRYLDRWSRRDGRWAIDARRHIPDLQTVTTLPGAPRSAGGTRDTTDPSYVLLG